MVSKKKFYCNKIDGSEDSYGVEDKNKKSEFGKIKEEKINDITYKITFTLNNSFKEKRIKQILNSIKNGLYSQSSGEANTIIPLFMIASGVKVPSPVFHSFIDIKKEDGKISVIGINDCLENGWIDGKVYLKGSDRIQVENDKTISDWKDFLEDIGIKDEEKHESSES